VVFTSAYSHPKVKTHDPFFSFDRNGGELALQIVVRRLDIEQIALQNASHFISAEVMNCLLQLSLHLGQFFTERAGSVYFFNSSEGILKIVALVNDVIDFFTDFKIQNRQGSQLLSVARGILACLFILLHDFKERIELTAPHIKVLGEFYEMLLSES